MPTEAKQATVAELRDELARSRTMIVSEYRGLTVREIADIRRALRQQDVRYRIVKNRLMRIAAGDGVDEAATAKAVIDATRAYKAVRITGGVLGNRGIDADGVTRLASLPPREVLLGRLA